MGWLSEVAMCLDGSPQCQQKTLEEFTDPERCQAIAISTDEQCERDALAGVPYCPEHFDLLDPDELTG